MKRYMPLFVLLLVLLVPAYCLAQESEESLLAMELIRSHNSYMADNSYSLALLIKIKEGYHINSTQPESPELIPTRLTLSGSEGISLEKYVVPPLRYHKIAGEEKPWAVWSGDIVFNPVITIADTVKPGSYNLTFALFYQSCDDQICQMPTTQELNFIIEVLAPQN